MRIKTRHTALEQELAELGVALKARRIPLERYLDRAHRVLIRIMRGK